MSLWTNGSGADEGSNCSVPPRPLFWPGAGPHQVTTDGLYLCKSGLSLIALAVSAASACTFSRQHRRGVLTQMLLQLSACEIVLSLTALLFETFYLLAAPGTGHQLPAGPVWLSGGILYGVWLVYKASSVTRNWLIVHIAWRRFRAVGDAIASRRGGRARPPVNRIAGAIAAAALLVTLPRVLEVTYERCPDTGQIVGIQQAEFATSAAYWAYPRGFFALHSLLPVCCLLGASCLTLCQLRRSHRRFLHDLPTPFLMLRRRRAQNDSVNRTVLVLCFVFVACELPMLVAGVLKDLDCRSLCDELQVFLGVANILTTVDSVANFVVYFLSIRNFRRRLCRHLVDMRR